MSGTNSKASRVAQAGAGRFRKFIEQYSNGNFFMKMRRLQWAVAVGTMFLASSLFSTPSSAADGEQAAVAQAVATQNAKYAAAVNEQDLPAFLALYTDDAVLVQGGKVVKDRSERVTSAKAQLAAIFEVRLKTLEIDVRGDLAYEVGEYSVRLRENRKPLGGSYVVIWKKQPGGEWKIHVEATVPAG